MIRQGDYVNLPVEIHGEIFSHLESKEDITSARLACKHLAACGRQALLNVISNNRVIVPRYENLIFFLSLVAQNQVSARAVRRVELVAEALKEPEHGYVWGWEEFGNREAVVATGRDMDKIHNINIAHTNAVAENNAFIHTGAYRKLLTMLFSRLPKLETVNVRKLRPGEHLPGWDGAELVKELSFYRNDLNTNRIFYGDWQYDETHQREIRKDEFGDDIDHPQPGPKATFIDDLCAAVDGNCGRDKVICIN